MQEDVTYWNDLLNEWRIALAKKAMETFFISSVENRNNMRTTYTNLGNSAEKFTDWLIKMRDNALYNQHGANVMQSLTFGVTERGQL